MRVAACSDDVTCHWFVAKTGTHIQTPNVEAFHAIELDMPIVFTISCPWPADLSAIATLLLSCFSRLNCRTRVGCDLHVLPLSTTPTSDCVHIRTPVAKLLVPPSAWIRSVRLCWEHCRADPCDPAVSNGVLSAQRKSQFASRPAPGSAKRDSMPGLQESALISGCHGPDFLNPIGCLAERKLPTR